MKYIEAREIGKRAVVSVKGHERVVRRVRTYDKRNGEDFHRLRLEFKQGGGITVRERFRVPVVGFANGNGDVTRF